MGETKIPTPYEDENIPEFNVRKSVLEEDSPLPSASHIKYFTQDFRQNPEPRWIKPGEKIEIADTLITDGMIYVGEVPRNSASVTTNYGPELINLSLEIAPIGHFTMRQTGYYPSYDALAPSGRRAYLHWLSQGRRHQDADPGLVFLFFYGLERRILTSPLPLSDESQAEWQVIEAELKALLSIYAARSPSFEGYASRLLEWMADFRSATDKVFEKKSLQPFLIPAETEESAQPEIWQKIWQNIQKTYPHPLARRTELPWRLRLALGQISRDALPLSPPMALAWLHYHPDISLRTPACRCPAQFDTLFMHLFSKKFPQWMRLLKSRKTLKKTYVPASHALQFHPSLEISFADIPDITPLKEGLKKLEEIAMEACAQLDLYSRALSKEPENPNQMDLQILLPSILWPDGMQEKIQDFSLKIKKEQTCISSFYQFFEAIADRREDIQNLPQKISLKQVNILLESLKNLHIFIAPLPTRNTIDLAETYCFFHYPFNEDEHPTNIPPIILLQLQLGAALALSDAHGLNQGRKDFLRKQLESSKLIPEALSPLEQIQGYAHLLYFGTLSGTKIFNLVKKTLSTISLTEKTKTDLLNVCIQQAKLSGMLSIGEIKCLEKIYKLFGQNTDTLPGDVSRGSIENSITTHDTAAKKSPIILDVTKIREKRAATQAISGILNKIFNEENETESSHLPASATAAENNHPAEAELGSSDFFPMLDHTHRIMVQKLLAKKEWTSEEINMLADELDLMAEGALEAINEASFDLYDEPFIEGGNIFEINPEILEILADHL